MIKVLSVFCSLGAVYMIVPSQTYASGFYPLVPTWSLVRGSRTAIRWKDSKRTEKNRAERKRRSAQIKTLRKHGRVNFDDDELDQTSAPLLVPADLLPLYVPESEFSDPALALPDSASVLPD